MSQLYQIYCKSEKKIIKEWSVTPLIKCPNSIHHEIDLDSVKIDESYNNKIIAEEASDGYFETTHVVMDIPDGTPGTVTEHDVTWPMDILLWKTLLTPLSDMIGDTLSVVAAPETTVGIVTSSVSIGATVINVNSTVTDNMWRGFLITLDDGVNKDVLGRCVGVDKINGTITVATPTTYSFAAMTTPVKISVYVLKDIYITDTNTIDIGGKGFKGKQLDANVILRVYYTNNSGTTKIFRWRVELYNKG